jgi:iron complex outermembrane receptor protein
MTTLSKLTHVLSAGVIGASVLTPSVYGQENRGTLEEVIVSAERREETVQSTPFSVIAFGADEIESSGAANLEDLQNFIPNLTITGGRGSGNNGPKFAIRGVGAPKGGFITGDRGVGLYVDDIYYPRAQGSLLGILDIERIEVLRGPQGTLFGKNNTGGAVRYITKRPDNEAFEARVKVAAGQDGLMNADVTANIPLSDTAALRVQYANLNTDGYIKQGSTELGDADDQVLRGVIRFEPSDALTVDLGITLTESENDGSVLDIASFAEHNDAGFFMSRRLNDALVNNGEAPLVENDPRLVRDRYSLPDYCLLDGDGDPYTDTGGTTVLDFGPLGLEETSPGCATPTETDTTMAFLDINYDLGENMSLRLLTGFSDVDNYSVQQFLALGTWGSRNIVTSKTLSQEIQLAGISFDEKLDWVVGAIYSQDETDQNFINYWLNPFQANFGVDPGFRRIFDLETTSYGVFGQATYYINETFNVTAGIRYSADDKDFTYQRHNHFQGNPLSNSDSWSSTDYRLSLEYNATDDLMFYSTVSTAYRAGGFNDGANNGLDFNGNGIADPGENNGGILPYDPESLTSYELGMRSEWSNNLRFNATYYYMDYSEIQAGTLDLSTNPATPLTANLGEATIQGLELELLWVATDNLKLNASLGTNDTELGSFIDPQGVLIETSGLPGSPELTYNIGANYFIPVKTGEFQLSLNYAFTDETNTNISPASDSIVSDYALVNTRVSYTSSDNVWSVSLLCNNCADEDYALGGSYFSTFFGGVSEYRARGRRVSAEFSYNF